MSVMKVGNQWVVTARFGDQLITRSDVSKLVAWDKAIVALKQAEAALLAEAGQ